MKKTLEQQYKEETGLNAYEPNNMRPNIPEDVYVEWLEDKIEQLALCNVVDTLPADDLIKSLGEEKEPNEYILKTHNRVWWIEHKHVGSGEPLKQWLTGRPVSG